MTQEFMTIICRRTLLLLLPFLALIISPVQSVYAAEHSLVGISIFSPAKAILHRFGNPTEVLTNGVASNAPVNQVAQTGAINGGLPPLNPIGQAAPVTSGQPIPDATPNPGEVTYVYAFANGETYQFLIAPNGKVIQITALGYTSHSAKTGRGIVLGSTYTEVLAKYGYPEFQERAGSITTLRYDHRSHVAFELEDVVENGHQASKVIGIVVGAVN